jgi:hypothetical protein
MLFLHINDRMITIFAEKAKMLREIFFLSFFSTDLFDIKNSFYSTTITCLITITEKKMKKILRRLVLDKTLNSNEISCHILRVCFKTLTTILILLFQSCIELSYHLIIFKMINTITIKKLEKDDYIVLKAYKFITFLNTLSKSLESIINRKIFYLTKTHRLLLDMQIRIRRSRFIELALKLLTK